MALRSIGLKSIKMGDIEADGGVSLAMTALGVTFKGSASFTTEEPTYQEFYSEENPGTPEESIVSEEGLKQIKFNIMDFDPAVLTRLFGGTTAVNKWSAQRETFELEQSVEIVTAYDVRIIATRCKVSSRILWNLSRTEIAQIEVTCRILTPEKVGEAPYSIEDIAA